MRAVSGAARRAQPGSSRACAGGRGHTGWRASRRWRTLDRPAASSTPLSLPVGPIGSGFGFARQAYRAHRNRMALLNWSMTMIGYPAHARSASRVVGLTHMTTHEALQFAEVLGELQGLVGSHVGQQFAENLGVSAGWLQVEGSQPQLERIREGTRVGVSLPELFATSRVIDTQGVASGALTFVAADPARGKPPTDRSLIAWAEEQAAPWLEVIDNDAAY